jgi:hypothetical protein
MTTKREIRDSRWEILWAAQRSQRYHSRRVGFFTRWNKLTAFAGVVGGSAALSAIFGYASQPIGKIAALLIVVLSGIDLVVGTAEMARRHNDLRRRFCELEADIAQSLAPGESDIAKWKSQRLTIESDEPPKYAALDILCENELLRAHDHTKDTPPHQIGWIKSLTAHLWRWENA